MSSSAKHGGALVDAHTPLHAIVGFAAGALGVDPHLAMFAFVGAKIVESALRDGARHALLEPEEGQSLGNEMADLLVEVAGLHYGAALRKKLLGETPAATAGLGVDYYDPRTHRYDDFMSYPRGYR